MVSETGDWLLLIALPVAIYGMTGSALGTSLALLIELIPGILLAPVVGRCADRWDRRRLLVIVSIVQALALVPLLAVHDRSGLPIVYAVIVLEAALQAFFAPAKNALLPTLVGSADLVSANALVGLGESMARLVGGPVGGVLLAAGGLRLVTVVDLVSYVAAAALIHTRSDGRPAARVASDANRRHAAGSYREVIAHPRVRATLAVSFLSQCAQGIFVALFIVFVAQRLHGGAAEVGLLRGVQAIGAIAGGLVLAALSRRWPPRFLTAPAALAFGLLGLLLWNIPAVSTSPALYVGLFILVGVPGIVLATGLVGSLQQATADGQHGRVFGAYGLFSNTGQVVGLLAAGLLAGPWGLSPLLDTQAALYLLAGALAGWQLTRSSPARAARQLSPASTLR